MIIKKVKKIDWKEEYIAIVFTSFNDETCSVIIKNLQKIVYLFNIKNNYDLILELKFVWYLFLSLSKDINLVNRILDQKLYYDSWCRPAKVHEIVTTNGKDVDLHFIRYKTFLSNKCKTSAILTFKDILTQKIIHFDTTNGREVKGFEKFLNKNKQDINEFKDFMLNEDEFLIQDILS